MNTKENLVPSNLPLNSPTLNDVIVNAIQDVKGIDIIKLDLRKIPDASMDYFIVCHGNSTTQVAGIIDNIERKVQELLQTKAHHVEGRQGRTWMLIDYFTTVVHIFSREKREFYNIEGMWSDAKITKYQNIV